MESNLQCPHGNHISRPVTGNLKRSALYQHIPKDAVINADVKWWEILSAVANQADDN